MFCKDVWQVFQEKLLNWAVAYSSIHVISGSIFDSDHNGLRDNDEDYNRCSIIILISISYQLLQVDR